MGNVALNHAFKEFRKNNAPVDSTVVLTPEALITDHATVLNNIIGML